MFNFVRDRLGDQLFHLRAFGADNFFHAILRNRIADRIPRSRTHHLFFIAVLPVDMQWNHLFGIHGINDRSIDVYLLAVFCAGSDRIVTLNLPFRSRQTWCRSGAKSYMFNAFNKRNDPVQARGEWILTVPFAPAPK